MDHAQTDRLKTLLLVIALAGLVAGPTLHFGGRTELARTVWFAGVAPVLATRTSEAPMARLAEAIDVAVILNALRALGIKPKVVSMERAAEGGMAVAAFPSLQRGLR